MNLSNKLDDFIYSYEHDLDTIISRPEKIYTEDIYFKDPFCEIQNIHHFKKHYEKSFNKILFPEFKITNKILNNDQAFLVWDFYFKFKKSKKEVQTIKGVSHIIFETNGLVKYHRDYWDPIEEIFIKLPLIGFIFKKLIKINITS
tara:strand:+ start:2729 stop:3163 length:435 start_codon:yes stop_codon:yes gene_type:complete